MQVNVNIWPCSGCFGDFYLLFGKDSPVFQYTGAFTVMILLPLYFWFKKRHDEPDPISAIYDASETLTLFFNFDNHEYAKHFLQTNKKSKEIKG